MSAGLTFPNYPVLALTFFSVQGLILLGASLVVAALTMEMIRRRLLRESYAMLWLLISATLLLFAIEPNLLFWISNKLGLYYLTVVFLVCFLLLMAIVMQYSIVLSRRAEENRQLAQRLALLQHRLEQVERRLQNPSAGQSPSADNPVSDRPPA